MNRCHVLCSHLKRHIRVELAKLDELRSPTNQFLYQDQRIVLRQS